MRTPSRRLIQWLCSDGSSRLPALPLAPGLWRAWFRCCSGHVRKLVDCCSYNKRRINGDASLTGYCYKGRRVYCVMYYDTKVAC